MKRIFVLIMIVLLATTGLCLHTDAAAQTRVEVLYMNHGPLMDTLSKMKTLFSRYGNKISVSWYDFDTSEGEQFMAKQGIRQHVPLVVWIDGSPTGSANGKKVRFEGFPTGSGPAFFQGKWTMDDLKAALDQLTAAK
jgi:hypothetical protein